MTKRISIVLTFFLIGAVAHASDWPGWRGDGTGVSEEPTAPRSWSETEGVAWKTAIPGDGYSSPIVWQDRIFLTTAVEGSLRARGHSAASALMWLLALVALWWYVIHVAEEFRHPPGAATGQIQANAGFIIRAIGVTLFLVTVFALYLTFQWRKGFTFVSVPTLPLLVCLGVAGAFVVVAAVGSRSNVDRSAIKTIPVEFIKNLLPRKEHLFRWLGSWLLLTIMASFICAVLIYPLTKEFQQLPRQIWPSTFKICCLGLIAAFAGFHRRSWWRQAAVVAAGFFFLVALTNVPRPGDWLSMLAKPVVWRTLATTLLVCGWFSWQSFRARKVNNPSRIQSGLALLGPAAMLILVAVYFLANNVLHKKAHLSLIALSVDRDTGDLLWSTKVGSRSSLPTPMAKHLSWPPAPSSTC